jgi:hypothetical protein
MSELSDVQLLASFTQSGLAFGLDLLRDPTYAILRSETGGLETGKPVVKLAI